MRRLLPLLLSGFVVAVMVSTLAQAQQLPRDEFPLWPTGAPHALGKEAKDVPTLTPFFANPDRSTGASVVVCPGGGYGGLAGHEGRDYAMWLNELGISAFVLKYRLGSGGYRHPVMLNDAARAVRYVRSKAAEWKLNANKVAIMGSSAGGHLASTLLTHYDAGDSNSPDPIDRQGSRPDAGILCYPVITMGEKTHGGSKRNLLGDNPSPELVKLLSNELQVTKDTPPTFLFHTAEDKAVPVQNSLLFADGLARAGVPFALHVYPKGPHGIGLGTRNWDPDARHPWTTQCAIWLKEQGFAR
jgi:acetyl esterase/lipase